MQLHRFPAFSRRDYARAAACFVTCWLLNSSVSHIQARAQNADHADITSLSDLVNPLIGTAADGQTFPAVGVPFSMTQWTPQTSAGEAKCVAPYYFDQKRFQGFRGSHFLSGSCTQDYGSVTVMPLLNATHLGSEHWSTPFEHTHEHASPYLYSVDLPSTGIRAEVTGTARSGIMRFRFTGNETVGYIGVEDNVRKGDGMISIDPAHGEITGYNPVTRIYQGNGTSAGFSGYFVIQFDQPFTPGGTWTAPLPSIKDGSQKSDPPGTAHGVHPHAGRLEQQAHHGPAGAYVSFILPSDRTIQVRIGTSFTSVEEAHKNLSAEIPDFDFDRVSHDARHAWDEALGHVQVSGNSPKRRVFYTALYHSLQLPRIFSDCDGSYPSFAGGITVEHADHFTFYTDYSLWDTFRALHPLLALLEPKRDGDMVHSLLAMGSQGGFLPIFPAWNSYTSEMIGDHADAVIADAFVKHLSGFDPEQAYQLMRHNALVTPEPALYRSGRGRRALDDYQRLGYIPVENPVHDAFHHGEQVSRTLEYAYDDSLVATMATALGHNEDAALFRKRAQNWKNVFDLQTGFVRGKHRDGRWVSSADPAVKQTWITEGLPFQYTFFVPQDIPGLIAAEGGPAKFDRRLDELFARNLYDQGNEPSHHIAYLYDYAGEPGKTQERIHTLLATYKDMPSGLPGNDDAGQMSAWYVFSALGFYPVSPGTTSYAFGTPVFDHVTLMLPNGTVMQIDAPGAEAGLYQIRSITLNGRTLNPTSLTHADLSAGGELHLEMSAD